MQNINPLTALRSLKGAPLSCLVALFFANQPVGKKWLARVTGYSDKPVSSAMDYLLEMGFVTSAGRCESWQIKKNIFHLPLNLENPLPESSQNYSDSLPTTNALNIESNTVVKKELVTKESPETCNPHFSESHQILKSGGIGEPMASRLSSMDHVTPYYLIGHIQQAKKDKIHIRLLIHRIRSDDPTPRLNQNYHMLNCSCSQCFNLIYYNDNGYLPPDDFVFEDYIASLKLVDSIN